MSSDKSSAKFIVTGIFSAIGTSLCCITPALALIAGTSGIGSVFSWIEPARPYLISLSILALGYAWFQKFNRKRNSKCKCDDTEKTSFLQSKLFLVIVTVFAILIMTFPLYSNIFNSKPVLQSPVVLNSETNQEAVFNIEGMTCEGCEVNVNNQLSNLVGIINYKTSYRQKNSFITFDNSKIDVTAIENAINKTGYVVKSHGIVNSK